VFASASQRLFCSLC